MKDAFSDTERPRYPHRGWHLALTGFYLALFVFSAPLALRSLMVSPIDGVSNALFEAYNFGIAALPFTIALSLAAAWIYHHGGAPAKYAFAPYVFPVINVIIIAVFRVQLNS